jgi:hypothetical protein
LESSLQLIFGGFAGRKGILALHALWGPWIRNGLSDHHSALPILKMA